MRNRHRFGFAEKPFHLQGNSTQTRPPRSAESLPVVSLLACKTESLVSAQRGIYDVICCWMSEPRVMGQAPGQTSAPDCAPSGYASAPALHVGSNPACHSIGSWERRRHFSRRHFPDVKLDKSRF